MGDESKPDLSNLRVLLDRATDEARALRNAATGEEARHLSLVVTKLQEATLWAYARPVLRS